MKRSISLLLAVILLLPSFILPASAGAPQPTSASFNVDRDCKNGKCIESLIDLAKAKSTQARGEGCLPPEDEKDQAHWFENNPMSVDCFKLVKEIEEIYVKLEVIQAHFSGQMLDDQERMCREEKQNSILNLENLRDIEKANAQASCTPARKKEVSQRCAGDTTCVLANSAVPFLGTLVNKILPANKRSTNCSAGKDNCLVQLATAFAKSVFSFFEGAWGLLKAAGKGIANAGKKFWNWVTGAEKQSSTAQLAAAKASEEEGIFKQLIHDFPGTMSRMWAGLTGAINEWLANDIFCQEWAGVPRASKCNRPAQGFACTDCKTMINGLCAISGVIVAEIVPAFLTGGLVTCAKYGVSAASKVSKLFKVSAATTRAIKASRVAKFVAPVTKMTARLTTAVVKSKFTRVAVSLMKTSVKLIGRFMISAPVKAMKVTFKAMRTVARTSKTFLMLTPAGPVITFGSKVASTAGKVILFPFENAMTLKSFQLGEKTFEKIFQKAGSAKLFGGIRPVLAGESARAMGKIDDAYLDMKITGYTKRHGSDFVTEAEDKYLKTIRVQRYSVVDDYLLKKPEVPLKNLIDDLYPDLKYGKFAKHLGADDILKAENDLFAAISKMPESANRQRLISEYYSHLSSLARRDALAGSPTFTRTEVIENALLGNEERANKALELTRVETSKMKPEKVAELKLAIQNAHEAGNGKVFNYKFNEIKEKYRILNEAGFTNKQAEILIRSGLAGKTDEVLKLERLEEVVEEIPRELILKNAALGKEERFSEALKLIKRESLTEQDKIKLAKTLEEAHLSGVEGEVFEYSWAELREKYRILVKGGFTKDEADLLMRSGLAGRPPVRELVVPGRTLFSKFTKEIVEADFPKREAQFLNLVSGDVKPKKSWLDFFKPNKAEAVKIEDNFQSLYFIDYQHNSGALNDILAGQGQIAKTQLALTYEKKAFENYKIAHNYLLETKPKINKNTLLEIHKKMMQGGVEDVPAAQLGKIRDGAWYGNVPPGHEINEVIRGNIQSNPYLTWVETSAKDGKFTGQIQYPNPIYVKKEGLDIIRKAEPQLVKEIEHYQAVLKERQALSVKYANKAALNAAGEQGLKDVARYEELNAEYTLLVKKQGEMTERLVDAMVDEQMDWFTRERTLLGDLDTPEKLNKYADLVAEFQRNLVSIHPLANGNGRSTREFALNYALRKEGFPPARIIEPNADIYSSLEEWQTIVKHGILSSDFLIDDLLERAKFGLPFDNSLDLITPYTRPPVHVGLKGVKGKDVMEGVEYIDPRLYREIIKREMAKDPSFALRLKNQPLKTWDEIHAKANEVFNKNNIYFNHPKNGIERVEIGFVDDDFKALYGKSTAYNKELYDFKMDSWYSDQIVWRGLASKTQVKSEAEIIGMFENLNSHMASNAVLGKIRGNTSVESIRNAAIADFEKYNSDVFGDGLVQMARDHSETGPMYGISYGYSTSKNREVGKAFAMGAMVVGEYGAHKAPELQALLKSRILVGARRGVKDVDLGRLKQLRPEFSYKYGRQQEIMGIGASDPDAINIIQSIDGEGKVIRSYLRSPEDPSKILVIDGDAQPLTMPKPGDIVKTIQLGK
ncbi:MAG: hypothetical protein K2P81_11215 [Bacteriovoracaceae bacterium]|nr:hypothetical protein [Bacteriovoracaceae bacterium]